jgi:hypothetical protein
MNQIVLNIDNHYTVDFLNYLKTLNYVKVQKVKKSDTSDFLQKDEYSSNTALLYAAKPTRSSVTLAQLAQEQGYIKTDWQRLNQLAKDMAIEEPIEELFAQLTP